MKVQFISVARTKIAFYRAQAVYIEQVNSAHITHAQFDSAEWDGKMWVDNREASICNEAHVVWFRVQLIHWAKVKEKKHLILCQDDRWFDRIRKGSLGNLTSSWTFWVSCWLILDLFNNVSSYTKYIVCHQARWLKRQCFCPAFDFSRDWDWSDWRVAGSHGGHCEDTTLCSTLEVNGRFRGTFHFHLQYCRISQARNQNDTGSKNSFLIFWSRRWRQHIPPRRWLTFYELHGFISDNIGL
jgi:hypothetical protein